MSERLPHLGHALFQAFAANPDEICQVDAATGQSATYSDTLKRSKLLATCFQSLAYKPGDVLALSGANHLDVYIPYYAGLACGLTIAGIDPLYKYEELKAVFNIIQPKIAFCPPNKYEDTKRVVADLQLDTRVVSFSQGLEESSYTGFLHTYGDKDAAETFVPVDFNGDETFAWLVSTSGTSGLQKFAAFYHTPLMKLIMIYRRGLPSSPPGQGPRFYLNLSTIQWLSAMITALCMPLVNRSQLLTSAQSSVDQIIDIINKYKPVTTTTTPLTFTQLLKSSSSKDCDLTCFESINLVGSPVPARLIQELRARAGPECTVAEIYGQTECLGPVLAPAPEGPIGNCGVPTPLCQIKLVDPETNEEVTEPGRPGELWAKNEFRFVEYYRNPTETANVITPDGWLRTGDLLYRDEKNYYFFVERLKMLIKYKGYAIVPLELESVIQTLPGVDQVAVTSVQDGDGCELPVAVVVRHRGAQVTAGDVVDIVESKLSNAKRLTGGVVFVDALPYTSSGKIARGRLKQLLKNNVIHE